MKNLFLFCRAGFEKECAAEIQQRAGELNVGGFVKANNNDAYVVYQCFEDDAADTLVKQLPLDSLIFARQMFAASDLLIDLPENDRISPIVAALSDVSKAGEVRVETPDTNEAKELSAFCRKFTVPLRQHLKNLAVCSRRKIQNVRLSTCVLSDPAVPMWVIPTAITARHTLWVFRV